MKLILNYTILKNIAQNKIKIFFIHSRNSFTIQLCDHVEESNAGNKDKEKRQKLLIDL